MKFEVLTFKKRSTYISICDHYVSSYLRILVDYAIPSREMTCKISIKSKNSFLNLIGISIADSISPDFGI